MICKLVFNAGSILGLQPTTLEDIVQSSGKVFIVIPLELSICIFAILKKYNGWQNVLNENDNHPNYDPVDTKKVYTVLN